MAPPCTSLLGRAGPGRTLDLKPRRRCGWILWIHASDRGAERKKRRVLELALVGKKRKKRLIT